MAVMNATTEIATGELNGGPVDPGALRTLALTNYGHFTTMLVEDGRVRGLELHLRRLARDCRTLFGTALDTERARHWARRLAPGPGRRILRLTVFDPALDLGRIAAGAAPAVLVTARPAAPDPPGPLRVRTAVHLRDLPEVKSVGLFGALRHRRAAQRDGFDDVLFTDRESSVSEGGTWNIGFVRGDRVLWPDAPCLTGTAMELLRDAGNPRTAPVSVGELGDYEAVFATNAVTGVRPVTLIDDLRFPAAHPTIRRLAATYRELPTTRL